MSVLYIDLIQITLYEDVYIITAIVCLSYNNNNNSCDHLGVKVPDSSQCYFHRCLLWLFAKSLSAASSLIRCNHISIQPCYIKHYLWQSGCFFFSFCLFLFPSLSPSFLFLWTSSSCLISPLPFQNMYQRSYTEWTEASSQWEFGLCADFFGETEVQTESGHFKDHWRPCQI